MIINKKRINSIDKYIGFIEEDKLVYICVDANEENKKILIDKGIINKYNENEVIIPKSIGPVTKFNMDGKTIIRKDLEKEQRQIERAYHCIDWHGNDHYGICYDNKLCYPIERKEPPLQSITLGRNYILSNILEKNERETLKHVINLFLEIFGYCMIVDKNSNHIEKPARIKRVEWTVLPPGKYPWEKSKKHLTEYFKSIPSNRRTIIERHHQVINQKTPDFLAIGQDSFSGYVVYGYNRKDIYVFEANQPNNASYIFKGTWEDASKLTKKEVLEGALCYKRLIHSSNWERNILNIIG